MSKKETTSSGGVSFLSLLFLLFLVLKLTGHIDWSWWWVTSPLWMPLAIVPGILVVVLVVMSVGAVFVAAIEALPKSRLK